MKPLVLAITAVLALAGCAAKPTRPAAPPPEADVAPEAARAFIERSLVLAPERVDKFTLVRIYDFEGRPDAGVGLRYQHADVPEMLLDLFVFPVGRVPRERALAYGMQSTRAELASAAAQGAYSDIRYGDEVAFDLRSVAADGRAGPAGGPGPDNGRRQPFRYVREEGPMDSLIFMFHRGLFLTKGRVSVLPTDLPGESFDRLANHAMATIVPAIEVRSTGACSSLTVEVDPALEGEPLQAQLMDRLMESQRQAEEENCTPPLDETLPAGKRGQLLVFPPEIWREG